MAVVILVNTKAVAAQLKMLISPAAGFGRVSRPGCICKTDWGLKPAKPSLEKEKDRRGYEEIYGGGIGFGIDRREGSKTWGLARKTLARLRGLIHDADPAVVEEVGNGQGRRCSRMTALSMPEN